jgi:hypothetical protein
VALKEWSDISKTYLSNIINSKKWALNQMTFLTTNSDLMSHKLIMKFMSGGPTRKRSSQTSLKILMFGISHHQSSKRKRIQIGVQNLGIIGVNLQLSQKEIL